MGVLVMVVLSILIIGLCLLLLAILELFKDEGIKCADPKNCPPKTKIKVHPSQKRKREIRIKV